jgi:hypothetical protein
MGAKSRNAKRVKTIEPETVIEVRTPIEEQCISRKKKFSTVDEVPSTAYDGVTALRGYLCDLCGWWHCTSGGTIRWRKPGRGNVQPGQEGLARR